MLVSKDFHEDRAHPEPETILSTSKMESKFEGEWLASSKSNSFPTPTEVRGERGFSVFSLRVATSFGKGKNFLWDKIFQEAGRNQKHTNFKVYRISR